MNDLKPFAKFGGTASENKEIWGMRIKGELLPVQGTDLYAIPSTHRVVSVELLQRIAADVSPFSHYTLKEELRAIIDNKEQP